MHPEDQSLWHVEEWDLPACKFYQACKRSRSSHKVLHLQLYNSSALQEELVRSGPEGTDTKMSNCRNQSLSIRSSIKCIYVLSASRKDIKILDILTRNEIQRVFYLFSNVLEVTFSLSFSLMKLMLNYIYIYYRFAIEKTFMLFPQLCS